MQRRLQPGRRAACDTAPSDKQTSAHAPLRRAAWLSCVTADRCGAPLRSGHPVAQAASRARAGWAARKQPRRRRAAALQLAHACRHALHGDTQQREPQRELRQRAPARVCADESCLARYEAPRGERAGGGNRGGRAPRGGAELQICHVSKCGAVVRWGPCPLHAVKPPARGAKVLCFFLSPGANVSVRNIRCA